MAANYHHIFDTFKHFWVARKPNFFDPSMAIGGAAISFFLNLNFGPKIFLENNIVKKIDCTHFWNYVLSKRLFKMAKKWGLRLGWSLVKLAKWWEILDSIAFSHSIGHSKSKKSAFSMFWAKKIEFLLNFNKVSNFTFWPFCLIFWTKLGSKSA